MLQRLRTRATARLHARDDGGFVLLESIISISLIVIVMAGLTNFFVSVTSLSGQLRARQGAVMFADNVADQLRSYRASDLSAGRSSSIVTPEFKQCVNTAPTPTALCAPASVFPLLSDMTAVVDTTVPTPNFPVSLAAPSTPNGTQYTAYTYMGKCLQPIAVTGSQTCTASNQLDSNNQAIASAPMLRVVIAVTWPSGKCTYGSCTFVSSTLIAMGSDQTFLSNQTPPNPPVINTINNQTSAINDSVTLQASLTSSNVVVPITWSSYVNGTNTLPTGLAIDNKGLISGTPTGPVGTSNVTITATDAFGRTDTQTFTWKILADLTISGINTTSTYNAWTNKAITSIAVSGAGGSGSGYTITATGLPTGLTFSSNTISGTATAFGSFNPTFTITDSTGRKRIYNYTWNVYGVLISAKFNLMANWAAPQETDYTCLSATCTLAYSMVGPGSTGTGLIGFGLATSPTGTGASSLTVPNGSGTVYVVGTPAVGAVAGNYTASVKFTDGSQVSTDTSAWTFITSTNAVSDQLTLIKGKTFNQSPQPNYFCASACTITLSGKLITSPFTATTGSYLSSTGLLTSASLSLPASTGTTAGKFYAMGTMNEPIGTYLMTAVITDADGNMLIDTATWKSN